MTKINDIGKKSIFEVPEGYFEHLPQKILTRIEGNSVSRRPLLLRPQFQIGLALALILIISIYRYWPKPETTYNLQESLSAIDTNELLQFAYNHDISFFEINTTVSIPDSTYQSIINESLEFNTLNLEEKVLMELETNSLETL